MKECYSNISRLYLFELHKQSSNELQKIVILQLLKQRRIFFLFSNLKLKATVVKSSSIIFE